MKSVNTAIGCPSAGECSYVRPVSPSAPTINWKNIFSKLNLLYVLCVAHKLPYCLQNYIGPAYFFPQEIGTLTVLYFEPWGKEKK